jgi:hypothetical protein
MKVWPIPATPGSILFVNALAASFFKLLPPATEAARRIILHRSKASPLITVSAVESKPATKGRIKTSHFFD